MKKIKSSWLNWRSIIIDDKDLSFGSKALGLYLNTFMNDSHDMAFPSLRRIECDMNLTKKTVIKYLAGLTSAGYLRKGKILSPSTAQYHNTYTALIPEKNNIVTGGVPPTPLKQKVVYSVHQGGVFQGTEVVYDVHPNKQGNKQRNKQSAKFEEFWRACPNKKDKKRAEIAFNRLSEKNQNLAIIDYPLRYQSTESRYIPLPTTYIRGERWNDEKDQSIETDDDGIDWSKA